MTTEQERALVDSLQDLERGALHMAALYMAALHMAARTMPSGKDYGKAQYHEGRADAFAEMLAMLKLADVKVEETTP